MLRIQHTQLEVSFLTAASFETLASDNSCRRTCPNQAAIVSTYEIVADQETENEGMAS